MSSIKIELRKKANQDGTYPLAIRITTDRKNSYLHTGKSIDEKFWDRIGQRVRKSHPNSERLNNYLSQKVAEANRNLLALEIENGGTVSASTIKSSLKPKIAGAGFFARAEMHLQNFKRAGKYNRYYPDQACIRNFKSFIGAEISFQDITEQLLTRFKAYLKGTKNSSERSIVNHLIIIRTVYNLAIKEQLVDQKLYPFGKEKIKIRIPSSVKIGLSLEEVRKIEEAELDKSYQLHHCRNLWLFSFYFAGIRVSDLLRLKWSDFSDDRLFYSMGKNLKAGSLKVSVKAMKILQQYSSEKKSKTDFVFPELKGIKNEKDTFEVQRKISYAVKRIDKHLEKLAEKLAINKKLTMHIARHTFGNISGDNISIQMLQKLYRHSSITTTIGYQANFIHKDADAALDAVIGE